MFTTYHDIFIRHAFGNFRDILREVSYSAMQGKYLTFTDSAGFSRSGKFPDENYAREFMVSSWYLRWRIVLRRNFWPLLATL